MDSPEPTEHISHSHIIETGNRTWRSFLRCKYAAQDVRQNRFFLFRLYCALYIIRSNLRNPEAIIAGSNGRSRIKYLCMATDGVKPLLESLDEIAFKYQNSHKHPQFRRNRDEHVVSEDDHWKLAEIRREITLHTGVLNSHVDSLGNRSLSSLQNMGYQVFEKLESTVDHKLEDYKSEGTSERRRATGPRPESREWQEFIDVFIESGIPEETIIEHKEFIRYFIEMLMQDDASDDLEAEYINSKYRSSGHGHRRNSQSHADAPGVRHSSKRPTFADDVQVIGDEGPRAGSRRSPLRKEATPPRGGGAEDMGTERRRYAHTRTGSYEYVPADFRGDGPTEQAPNDPGYDVAGYIRESRAKGKLREKLPEQEQSKSSPLAPEPPVSEISERESAPYRYTYFRDSDHPDTNYYRLLAKERSAGERAARKVTPEDEDQRERDRRRRHLERQRKRDIHNADTFRPRRGSQSYN